MKKASVITFIGVFLSVVVSFKASAQLRMPVATRDTAIAHPVRTFAPKTTSAQIIPQNYYTQHFGFFCRQELKLQQAKVPVTFRLGSMDECNRLEQKSGYR